MDDYQLLIDLHKQGHRQGPGGDAETLQALRLARIDRLAPLKVADIGCGTGASTLLLAQTLNAHITAVDFLQDFLNRSGNREEARAIVAAEQREIELYETHKAHFGYGVYIAKKL